MSSVSKKRKSTASAARKRTKQWASVPSQPIAAANYGVCTPCPVCRKDVLVSTFNFHLDECLVKHASMTTSTTHPKPEDSSHSVQCPIGCGKDVSLSQLNDHIDQCVLLQDSEAAINNHPDPAAITCPAATKSFLKPLRPFSRCELITSQNQVPGLYLLHDFISAEEEAELVKCIDADTRTPWKPSTFSGHCLSKCYGVITQYGLPGDPKGRGVRQNNPLLGEYDIPDYLIAFPKRLQDIVKQLDTVPVELKHFLPNECNCNSYESSQNHCLLPHFDDRALSGPLLMNLSLNCDAYMTYTDVKKEDTKVVLPRRCLQIVIGPARWVYQHGIRAEDILGSRRVSVTWRQAGSKNIGIRKARIL